MLRSLIVTLALFLPALAADDPFIGKWKLDLAKSKLTGQVIQIKAVPGNGYEFKEDEHTDVIFADGLDHVTHFGDSMAITQKKPDLWAITYKQGNRVVMNTTWKISKDGKILTYTATGTRPNGQNFTNQLKAKRVGGSAGLAGSWETVDVTLSSPREIYIEPYRGDGHAITFPGRKETLRIKYDGNEYPDQGPTVTEGSTSSGRRLDARTIETTERLQGKLIEVAKATISADGNTQTIVVTEPGEKTPVVLVYERER